jgi:exonuclease III
LWSAGGGRVFCGRFSVQPISLLENSDVIQQRSNLNNKVIEISAGRAAKTLNIMFWNCHGIKNFFNIDLVEIKILQDFSIIGLCETWALEKISTEEHFFRNYNLVQREALRIGTHGRGIGGLLLLVHKRLRYNVVEENDNFLFVEIKGNHFKLIIGLVYLRFGYEVDGILRLQRFFNNNAQLLSDYSMIIGGDFNARVGELNNIADETPFFGSQLSCFRSSLDSLVNRKGRLLVQLMEENMLYVLNGRTVSDTPGQFTFLNDNGSSAIDYVWINTSSINRIDDFAVCDFILSSDHLPLLVKTNFCVDREPRRNDEYQYKFIWEDKYDEVFKRSMQLSNRLLVAEGGSIEQLSDNLIRAIKESAQNSNMLRKINNTSLFRNKQWFDMECNISKRKVRRLYRKAKRQNFLEEAVIEYLEQKRLHKNMLNLKKQKFYDTLKLNLTKVKSTLEFWKAVKLYKGKSRRENNISLETWITFLENKYIMSIVDERYHFCDALHPYLDNDFQMSELSKVLTLLKNKKTPGSDGLQYEFYKALPYVWKEYLLNFFNKILQEETFPTEWSKIKLFFLYKKGDKNDPTNYRGIALINTLVKMFTRLLQIRLSFWAENCNILPEGQSGFRTGRSCLDNIFVLHTVIINQIQVKHRKLFGLFVDFESAFDSVPHSQLWYKLGLSGVSSKIIRLLDNLYSAANLFVDNGEDVSEPINVSRGVLQGDSISPLLFSLYVRDIEHFFREKGLHGISVSPNVDIMILLFADDIVILADSDSDLKIN